jgi:hypothetical protein
MSSKKPDSSLFARLEVGQESKPIRRKKGFGDRMVENDGRRLRFSRVSHAFIWYSALRLSPSYELARQCMLGELPENAVLPEDFETVLSVFDDLGDVQVDIEQWVNDRAFRAFGHGGKKPSVVPLGIVRHDGDVGQFENARDKLYKFAASDWIETSLVAIIPNGLSKAQMMKQIAAMLDDIPPADRDVSPVAPKYKILAKGRTLSSTRKYLRCVERRAANPELTLWQIGNKVGLSSTYRRWFDPKTNRTDEEQADARNALKILTSRALHRGHMIAENAARGIFPSYAKCEHAIPIDWTALRQRLD